MLAGLPMNRRAQLPVRRPAAERRARGRSMPAPARAIARGTSGLDCADPDQYCRRRSRSTIDGVKIVFQLAARDRGAGRDAHVLSGLACAQHGGECLSAVAQFHPAAGRGRTRSAGMVEAHRRCDQDVRATRRGADRPAPLADLGQGGDRRLPRGAARSLQAHPRPDPALHEQGLAAVRDLRGHRPAAGPRRALVGAGLLRHGQPQCEGGLSAVSELVRRQSMQSPCAAACAGGTQVRRIHGRCGGGAGACEGRLRQGRVSLGRAGDERSGVR